MAGSLFTQRRIFSKRPVDNCLVRSSCEDKPEVLLFVCTANIARSPYAELIASTRLDDLGLNGRLRVISAGIPGISGRRMDPRMAGIALDHGVATELVEAHRSRSLSLPLVYEADLIVAMTVRQRNAVLDEYPGAHRFLLTVGQLEDALNVCTGTTQQTELRALAMRLSSRRPATVVEDVEDPFHAPPEVAKQVAKRIDTLVERLVEAIF